MAALDSNGVFYPWDDLLRLSRITPLISSDCLHPDLHLYKYPYNFIREKKLKSIALPAISAGVYGFPAKKCAEIMMSACFKYIERYSDTESTTPVKILLCLYGQEMYNIFTEALENELEKRK